MVRMNPVRAFKKRCVARDDGVAVLTRPLITTAALEAGYSLPSPVVDEEVLKTRYQGQMTQEEFVSFCEQNDGAKVPPSKMAAAIYLVAPTNVITRASLEEILNQSSGKKMNLTEDEIDTLFDTLDTTHSSCITGDKLMRDLYGEDGIAALEEQKYFLAEQGMEKQSYDAQKEKQRLREEEEERERQRQLELERERERERLRQEEEARLAKEKAEREAREAKERAEKERRAREDKEKADRAAREAADKGEKEKAKGCC